MATNLVVILVLAGAPLILLGVRELVRGLRGRRRGTMPTCVACGFDLTGLAEAGDRRCPECGAGLGAEEAVAVGQRVRRPVVAAVGGVLLLLGLTLASAGVWAGLSRVNVEALKPMWLLEREARSSSAVRQLSAWAELERRTGAGASVETRRRIALLGYEQLIVGPAPNWPWTVRQMLEGAWTSGLVGPGDLLPMLQRGVVIEIVPDAVAYLGSHARATVRINPGRAAGPHWLDGRTTLSFGPIPVGGTADDIPGLTSTVFGSGWPQSTTEHWSLRPLDGDPGARRLAWAARVRIALGQGGPECAFDRVVEAELDVRAAMVAGDNLVDDADAESALSDAVEIPWAAIRVDDAGRYSIGVPYRIVVRPGLGVVAQVLLHVGGAEPIRVESGLVYEPSDVQHSTGFVMGDSSSRLPPPVWPAGVPVPEQVDIELRPDGERARRFPPRGPVLGRALWFRGVPVRGWGEGLSVGDREFDEARRRRQSPDG